VVEVPRGTVIEHGTSPGGRWLRSRRLRLALWIAVIEGLLVALHVIPWWLAALVAVAAISLYFWAGRSVPSDTARQLTWVAATSQALVALVPVLVLVVGTLALIVVAVLAVVALIALFADRR
jgi:hypothetical protein